MPTLDWIFLVVLLASLVLGAWRGLVYELLSLLSWLAAFVLAQWFAADAAQWLPLAGAGASLRYAGGFVLVFVVTVFAGGLVAFLIKKLVAAVGMGPADRLLGAGFGLLRGAVMLLAVTLVVGMTPASAAHGWQEAVGPRLAAQVLAALKPVLPQEFGKYVP